VGFVEVVKETLGGVGRGRWGGARMFVQLLDAREMMLVDGKRFRGLSLDGGRQGA